MRMRSILDTRPKGAPGRDKPVPYDGIRQRLETVSCARL